jgi:hypothetical protein
VIALAMSLETLAVTVERLTIDGTYKAIVVERIVGIDGILSQLGKCVENNAEDYIEQQQNNDHKVREFVQNQSAPFHSFWFMTLPTSPPRSPPLMATTVHRHNVWQSGSPSVKGKQETDERWMKCN